MVASMFDRDSAFVIVCTVVAGVAIVAVQLVVAHAHVGTHEAIAEPHVAHAALETLHVVKQPQALDYHRRSSSCNT